VKPRNLIIRQPSLQSPWQKYSYGLCTVVAWALWIYLWLPLISLVAWLLGFRIFYRHMIELGGWTWFRNALTGYLSMTAILCGALILWALYNQIRFRGRERRGPRPPAQAGEIGRFFGLDASTLERARRARRLVIRFDDRGAIREILTGPDVPASPSGKMEGKGRKA